MARSRRVPSRPARPARRARRPVHELGPGVIERVASTETPDRLIAVVARGCPARARSTPPARGRRRPRSPIPATRHDPSLGRGGRRRRRGGHPGSVDVFNPKVVRASAGALFHVPVVDVTLDDVAAAGLPLLGTSSHQGVPHDEPTWSARIALVVGNEAHGCPTTRRSTRGCASTTPAGPRASTWRWPTTVLCFEAAASAGERVVSAAGTAAYRGGRAWRPPISLAPGEPGAGDHARSHAPRPSSPGVDPSHA